MQYPPGLSCTNCAWVPATRMNSAPEPKHNGKRRTQHPRDRLTNTLQITPANRNTDPSISTQTQRDVRDDGGHPLQTFAHKLRGTPQGVALDAVRRIAKNIGMEPTCDHEGSSAETYERITARHTYQAKQYQNRLMDVG